MRNLAGILCAILIACPAAAFGAEKGLTVKGVRYFSYPGFTRIVFETEETAPYALTRSSDGKSLYFSSYGGPFVLKQLQLPLINDGVIKGMELRQERDNRAVIITLGPAAGEAKDFVLRAPDRIVLDVLRGSAPAGASDTPSAKAPVVVIDAGHGGTESGIVAAQGVEKTAMLDQANSVRKLLKKSGARITVLLTREQDQAMTLDERAAYSNAAGAILFVSLHAAPGQETRVLILDPDEGQLSSASGGPSDFLGYDAMSERQQMLWGTQQARHAQESGRFGRSMARALSASETAEPEQAPLAGLKAVDATAVLIETGIAAKRGNAAEAIAREIEQYVRAKR